MTETAGPEPTTWQEPVAETAEQAPDAVTIPVQAARRDNGRSLRFGIVGGVAALVVAGLAVTMAAAPAPAKPSAPGLALVAATPSPAASASPGIGTGRGNKGDRGMGGMKGMGPGGAGDGWTRGDGGRGMRSGFGAISIAAINGSSLSLKTADGWTRTIAITDATTVTRAGEAIKAADLKVGDTIRFSQTKNTDGTYTITAIAVIVPQVTGTVSDKSGDTFTIKDRRGLAQKVTTTSATTYALGPATGSASDVTVGATVLVAGTSNTDGSINALHVQVDVPRVSGTVTKTASDTITITRRDGTAMTIHVSSKTTYQVAGKASATLADITADMVVLVQGTQRADGSIDALSVAGGTGGPGPGGRGGTGGPDGRGGHGRGGDSTGPTPSASPATNG